MGTRAVVKLLVMLVAVLLALPVTAAAQPASASASDNAAKSWTVTRTPWGDPDIQGLWPANDMQGTPYERPESFGTRATLNDEEFAARQEAQARQA